MIILILLCYARSIQYYNTIRIINLMLKSLKLGLAIGALSLLILLSVNSLTKNSQNLLIQSSDFSIQFESISSILRTDLTSVYTANDTIFVGDSVGSLAIWTFNEKKKVLEYQDISREISGSLPPVNKVIDIKATSQGVLVLTENGKVTVYPTNSASKITGQVDLSLNQTLKEIVVFYNNSDLILSGITQDSKKLCVYKMSESLIRPNPVIELACNITLGNFTYSGIDYDSVNKLIAVGDSTRAVLFSVANSSLSYLCEAFLQKAEEKGFKSIFTNSGVLIAINDLWISSLVVDMSVPYAKVISSDRTEKLLKVGGTTWVSVNKNAGAKSTTAVINSKNKIQGFTVGSNNKLSYGNDSRTFGKLQNFMMSSPNIMFGTALNYVVAIDVNDAQQKQYFTQIDSYPIESHNHFERVIGLGYWNGTLVTGSDGGKNNLKLWKFGDNKLTFVDQKTISFFSLLKAGPMSLSQFLMMPPPSKSNANATLHFIAAGNDPFNLVLVTLNTQGKLNNVVKSKQQHYSNITSVFMTPDQKGLITSSMDTLIKIWPLSTNRDQFQDNATTVTTKYGPIKAGIQDKTGNYYIYGHCSTSTNQFVNITLWKLDAKKGVVKIAENVPGEAHQSNLTQLLLSRDQKYFVTLSESGELRLWQHKQWTAIDLLASLSLGQTKAYISMTDSNTLIIEKQNQFIEYAFDFNGFILIGKSEKKFNSRPYSSITIGNSLVSGDEDGAIRVYSFTN